jgi:hypothetical protein
MINNFIYIKNIMEYEKKKIEYMNYSILYKLLDGIIYTY